MMSSSALLNEICITVDSRDTITMPFATPYYMPLRKLEIEDDPDKTPTQTPRRMPPVLDFKPLDDDVDGDPRPRPDIKYMIAQGKHAELRALSYALGHGHHEDYAFDNEDLDALVAWEEEEEPLAYKEYYPLPVYHEADAANEWKAEERRRRKEEKAKRKKAALESSTSTAGWLSTKALLGLSVASLSVALMLWMIFWVTADNHMLVLVLFV
ncbi:TPA_exp: Uncharacterized protein A8136_1562 [Trichophyton benhamiae CBS 112371]|nr:TPA_exp: Uncharacterized protein A8136_1562 [Trichophyton benhamiae CBS 112371]